MFKLLESTRAQLQHRVFSPMATTKVQILLFPSGNKPETFKREMTC